jgi:predicted outer membrane repeat protein
MKKNIFLTICILMVTNLFATDYYVKAGGNNSGGLSEANAFSTVGAAVTAAADNDRIYIVGSISQSTTVSITKSLAFVGMGNAVITGSTARLYSNLTTGKTISFTGITFQNVNLSAATNGAAFSMTTTSNATFTNCVFHNNKTAGQGGALEVTGGGSLIVTNCTFTNNVATVSGGAITVLGGAKDLTISGSTFTGNSTVSGTGGAINAIGTAPGVLSVTTSLFNGNNAGTNGTSTGGGAIYVGNNLRQALISYSTFYNNTATFQGGAIYAVGTNATSKFTNITCFQNKTKLTTSTTDRGGAIRIEGDRPFAIENSLVYGNSVAADGTPLASDIGVATTASGTSILTLTKSLFGASIGLDAGDSYATSNTAANLTSSSLTYDDVSGKVKYGLPTPGDASPIDYGTDGNDVGAWDSGLTLLNTWTGATSTDWTVASNWNAAGVPDATKGAVIETGTYQPIIGANASVKSLTLNASSSLTVNSGYNLTVTGAVANNGGTMTIENNANLIQGGTTNTNTGNVIVKRNSSNIQLYDYTLWSSPVAGQKLKAFSPNTLDARFYTYNSATNQYNVVSDPATTDFAAATGYLIRAPNTLVAGATAAPYSGTFTGVPNNGTINVTGLTSSKFYAVGNPYPSTISANLFLSGNTTDGTFYFWRKTNNSANTSYATYTTAGGVANSGGGSSVTPDGTIQVGQGFIVKTGASSTALNFTNSMRTSSNTSPFLRTTEDRSRFWLNLTNTSGLFSQMLVAYMAEATSGIDNAIDGCYINDSPFALTSLIGSQEYTIQGRALPFSTSDSVPLGFKTDATGNYTIAIDHVDGLFSTGQMVLLKDNLLNTVTDLNAGSYSFASAIGTFNSRFEVVYQSTLAVTNPTFTANSVIAFSANGEIRINSGSTVMEQVRVYDLQGRLLVEKKQINAFETTITTSASNQVLLLEITATNGSKITKKIIQ